ncbi:MAG: DNA polymerase III subunit alpha [Calditrichota bacterium]
MFVHLHNHSDYSLLDGACRIGALIQTALDHGSPAVALTDHGNLFGALEFYVRAREAGIKPLIGCELYMAPGSRFEKKPGRGGEGRYHLVLIAKNQEGYRNLSYLASEGFLTGFYYKPRIDKELLAQHAKGLICLSSCLKGEIPQLLVENNIDAAREATLFYRGVFGDDFYLELHRHGLRDQDRIIPHLVQIAQDYRIKMVATNDAHYMLREHAVPHDILLCVGTQAKRDDAKRMRFDSQEFYFKSPAEMEALFADLPEAIINTLEIADKCSLDIDLKSRHFPVFKLADQAEVPDADAFLREFVEKGFRRRYGDQPDPLTRQKLEQELAVISQTGFSNYFLIVWDFVRWAKEHKIPVGPGRGSAAGSVVSYCLGITNLDPIKYGLIFERFLNPERVSPPDIDIDFSDDRREEVIQYVREKYGAESVCRITTFGRMAAKSAVRDVARALNLTYAEADRIARLIPEGPKVTLESAIKEVPDLRDLISSDPRCREVIDNALIIEGAVRHAGTHAAGVVIAPGLMTDFIPVYKQSDDNEVYTQYDMHWIDAVGLLKMDFLGLQTLQELDLTVKSLRRRGIEVDLDNLPLEDQKVLDLFGEGRTVGVFQFESSGMRDNLMKLKPERIEDLLAMNALYRPGPMQFIDEYITCRHGRRQPSYLHPKLEPILQETYGVIVYQEQVIRIATDLGGFSLGKADNLRWAMSKKKLEMMLALKEDFIRGCVANDIPKASAEAIFSVCEQFANYGFVKAHAAGYALIAYQCAYLKTYYPADFLASCLTVRRRNPNQVLKLLSECRKYEIPTLPPDLNESEYGFVAAPKGIRFGLAAVRNVGDAAAAAIVEAGEKFGPFTSLHHFLTSADLRVVNRKVVESLVDAGAFDAMGPNRATLQASLTSALAYAQAIQTERLRGQTTLFGGVGVDPAVHIPPPQFQYLNEWPLVELQAREKRVLGYYVSSHPLDQYQKDLENLTTHRLADREEFHDGLNIRLGAVITSVKFRPTRTGDKMAVLVVEDLTGSMEALVFNQAIQNCNGLIEADKLVGLVGKISRNSAEDEPKLRVDEIIPLEQAMEKWGNTVRIKLDCERLTETLIIRLEQVLAANPGNCPVYMDVRAVSGGLRTYRVGRFTVRPAPEMIERLTELLGGDRVQVRR